MEFKNQPFDLSTGKVFLHKELSFLLRGLFFNIANVYGLGLKEKVYHQALIDNLTEKGLSFVHEPQIPIYSVKDGRKIGVYIPDFIVNGQIIIEAKSEPFINQHFIKQVLSYLRVTPNELAFIVNFGADEIDIRRFMFTNDRKPNLANPSFTKRPS